MLGWTPSKYSEFLLLANSASSSAKQDVDVGSRFPVF